MTDFETIKREYEVDYRTFYPGFNLQNLLVLANSMIDTTDRIISSMGFNDLPISFFLKKDSEDEMLIPTMHQKDITHVNYFKTYLSQFDKYLDGSEDKLDDYKYEELKSHLDVDNMDDDRKLIGFYYNIYFLIFAWRFANSVLLWL